MPDDIRDRFLARVVKDKSFADVGGLWGTVNERVSVAHQLGARELAMIDVTPEGAELWQRFDERMDELGIAGCRCVASDLALLQGESFEVVHCSGVLYHHPDPISLVVALRRLATEHVVLTSAVTAERIENEFGCYEIPESGALFVPGLSEAERRILAQHWSEAGATVDGIHNPVHYRVDDFGPWWWLPTRRTLAAMCEAAGTEILEQADSWAGYASTLLLRVV